STFREESHMRASFRGLVVAVIGVALGLTALAGPASATLNVFASFPDAALSIDGATDVQAVNPLQSNTPAGATIVAAYLYVSDVFGGGVAGDVTLNGPFPPVDSRSRVHP